MKIISGILGGLLLWLPTHFVVNLTLLPALIERDNGAGLMMLATALSFIGPVILGLFIASTAATPAKVWRKMLIITALFCFALPIAGMALAGGLAAHTAGSAKAGATAGFMLGGGLFAGVLGIFGFFAGGILLIIGLLVGRDPKIIYVQAAPPPAG